MYMYCDGPFSFNYSNLNRKSLAPSSPPSSFLSFVVYQVRHGELPQRIRNEVNTCKSGIFSPGLKILLDIFPLYSAGA